MIDEQPQQQPQQQPQRQPRKKRTATRLRDKTDPEEVDFNNIGQHCGKKQNKFAVECGVITRSVISIEHKSWKKVPDTDKDILWSKIKDRWDIQNEKRRQMVLKTCGSQWRSFKKRLKSDFLDNERDPRETYTYLESDKLEIFKEYISSEEFKEKSEKAKKSSKHNTNPAKVGPHGYRGNKAKWEQEMASGEMAPQLYQIKSERSRDYVLGRRGKATVGSNTIPPNIQPLVNKLVEVQEQISQGDVVPGPGEDLLTMVIGPEHPGRTRAVGQDIGLRIGMQGFDQKKRKSRNKESVDKLQETLDQAMLQLAELQAKVDMQERRTQVPNDVSVGGQNNGFGSTSALDALKVPTDCYLMLPYGSMDQKCAKGTVFPYKDGLIHSVRLQDNHLKVLIDEIDERFGSFPLPVIMNEEVSTLERAVGTSIQWPRIAIVLIEEQRAQQQKTTTSLLPTIATSDMNKKMPSQTTKKSKPIERPIETLRERLKTKPVVDIVANSGYLQSGTYNFSVSHDEFMRLLKREMTDVSIITAWQMILLSMVRTRVNKCAFLNPYMIQGEACQKNPEGVVSYLVDAMRLHHGKLFLIAPYLQNKHWVLLVICPRNRNVYILDSRRKPIELPIDTYCLLKGPVDMAFVRYEKEIPTPVKWILAECNQEPSISRVSESGHYVMKWMFDFVMTRQYGFPSTPGTLWNDKTTYKENILVTTVATWAREFLGSYMKDVIV